MKRLKKLFRPLGIALGITTALVLLGFVERTTDRTPIAALEVTVDGGEGVHFIDEMAVRRAVMDQGTAVLGAAAGDVAVAHIEERLRQIPCVAEADVYHDLDGTLHVKVRQREPVVRVLNGDGGSFYIDDRGWTMPTDPDYTARVLVVTGSINEPGTVDGVYDVHENDSLAAVHLSDDIHRLAMFIRKDPLWNALIDQVVVLPDGGFELVPTVGAQRILIGDGTALEERFAKLRLFYSEGMPRSDWRRYARIDLRFADQIVCTKRNSLNTQ